MCKCDKGFVILFTCFALGGEIGDWEPASIVILQYYSSDYASVAVAIST